MKNLSKIGFLKISKECLEGFWKQFYQLDIIPIELKYLSIYNGIVVDEYHLMCLCKDFEELKEGSVVPVYLANFKKYKSGRIKFMGFSV